MAEHAARDGDARPLTPEREIDIVKSWVTGFHDALVVRILFFKGRPFVDARRYFTDAAGKFAPTRKGFAISLRKLPELQKALAKAEREARAQGLIDGGGGDA